MPTRTPTPFPTSRPDARPRPPLLARSAIVLLPLVLVSCTTGNSTVTGPPPEPPPGIVSVYPAPRSAFVDYLTDIWAQFDRPLDPASVNGKTVYLKLDTVRLPAAVTYDSTTHRVRVRPVNPLALLTTYSIELSASVRAVDGQPFGGYLWQFTTQSVRHPNNPFPADGAADSPFATVSWGGNETTPGTLLYELYSSPDSAAVAARTATLVYRGTRTLLIPRTRWHEFGTNYWSITVENQTQGERYNGPVWRFTTPASDVPVDSVDIVNGDFGYQQQVPVRVFCQTGELITGNNYRAFLSWQLVNLPSALRLAGARWVMSSTVASQDSLAGGVNVYASNNGPSCGFRVNGTPDFSLPLAVGTPVDPRTVMFNADALTAHIEAAVRRGGLFGYFLTTPRLVHFISPFGSETNYLPKLRLWYYHPPSTPARAGPAPLAARAPGLRPVSPR